ncbi:hypothetical protein FHR31_001162 [Parvibacter caecicola]|uniref:Uncharacterized protein n=1 Tax=Parvibacter caecicola TaxID=747645 RepID=A0A7W5GQD0_9ACTN|nr:hypothetical protein [Parvibacter caecicola]
MLFYIDASASRGCLDIGIGGVCLSVGMISLPKQNPLS